MNEDDYSDDDYDQDNMRNVSTAIGLVVDSVGMSTDPSYMENKYRKLNDAEHEELSSRRRR